MLNAVGRGLGTKALHGASWIGHRAPCTQRTKDQGWTTAQIAEAVQERVKRWRDVIQMLREHCAAYDAGWKGPKWSHELDAFNGPDSDCGDEVDEVLRGTLDYFTSHKL